MTDGRIGQLRHEAVVYRDLDEYVTLVGAFVDEGVDRDEPVMVLTDDVRIAALQDHVGDRSSVRYGDVRNVGRNPARLLAMWRDFVEGFSGQRVRGVGESVWPGRDADALDECALHESLTNVAFAESASGPATREAEGHSDWQLLCPYDAAHLDAAALALATDHHPAVISTEGRTITGSALGPAAAAALFARPLRPAPEGIERLEFERASLIGLRHHVRTEAVRLGISGDRAEDFTLAVDEVATNSVVHGGGHGVLRLWLDQRSLICEVSDRGHVPDGLVGRYRPPADQMGGRGLWMANQLCDLVQLRSTAEGTTARLHLAIG